MSGSARPGAPASDHPVDEVTARGPAAVAQASRDAADPTPREASPVEASIPRPVQLAAAWAWRVLLIMAAAAVGVWAVSALKTIVVPVAIAILLAVLLAPVARFLRERLRLPRALAAGASLIGLLGLVGGLLTIAGNSVVRGFSDLGDQAAQGVEEVTLWLAEGPLHLSAEQIEAYIDQIGSSVSANSGGVVSGALSVTTTLGHVAAGALIALFCTFFFLLDGGTIWRWCVGLLPGQARARAHQAARRGLVTLGAYTRTQILVAFVDAVGIGTGAAILGVPLALPLSILVFIGSFVPFVGAVLTGSIAVLVALVSQGPGAAIIMLVIVLVVQQIEGHVLQPLLMGHAVSLHPVAVLLAVASGSFLAGVVGALLAVPVVAVLNTVILYLSGHDKFPTLGDEDAFHGSSPQSAPADPPEATAVAVGPDTAGEERP
ncbi:AI-2E family transporter [Cellulomonas chengniuliangii]|uniref:AI-2E family transporter n=1 Tax=Cellulomonas chengniuliangii TaxID=2968084 RepID=A0ABY5L011_9CELL|nr:AI-2E family transporter [Cellulomonas chengniuliangii]MCC2307087.1 AI-2E family transporter [Cellulomonas chengniuliangii]MCC2316470.1 AI-2E family transporter [Cellulomonas chengniuliangii]UUI76115.1 AI-2E family transporter [Cellulomonas chengniuliangii]